jgi:hypothetical protein
MTNQDFRRESGAPSGTHEGVSDRAAKAAKEGLANASSFAGQAADKARQVATETAANITDEVKGLLNRQVGGGADILGSVARSARLAAADMDRDAPEIAGLVRTFASRVDGYSQNLRGQSVDQLWRNAADFTRRQPAVVFGLAALAGFFALRLVKSSPSVSAPPIAPSQPYHPGQYRSGQGGHSYGA